MNQHQIKTVGEEERALRLDTPTVEARTAHYPEELREPVSWLATYVREECNRDLGILTDIAQKLEVPFDKTNWSKILRGRWNRDAQDHDLETPIISLQKLLRGIDTLRKDAQLKEQAGKVPFIMTPTAQEIFNYVSTRRAPDRVNKFGMIVGHTGTQKSATLAEYCRRNNHGNCVMVEAPSTPSQTQFITDLAEKYGCSRQATWDRKRNTISKSVNSRKCIIVENIQRLYSDKAQDNQVLFSYLQKLQEDTGCAIIMTLTPVFVNKLKMGLAKGYFEQFIGRAGGNRAILTLEDYPAKEDVVAIAKAFGLQVKGNVTITTGEREETLPVDDYLVRIAHEPGRIRVLFEALQAAKVRATSKKKDLTIEHVLYVREED